MRGIRNIFACLVHENQECVIDLLRNLRYLDPDSTVLLYNGGDDEGLLDGGFPWESYGAVVHPQPRPNAWGRLHDFALDCMEFALEHLPFDTLTIVDSDQLALRTGYSGHLAQYLKDQREVGMLSNAPAPQTSGTRIAPAAAALREIDLWRNFLRRFPEGEEKFVHWTFWPMTVFTAEAARDLTGLFDTDQQLQELMERTKIWATEEVILPTLVALLGHKIVANPCSDDYVKFRVSYTPQQIDAALSRSDVFWIHPIARQYQDRLRQHIRSRLNQYEKPFRTGGKKKMSLNHQNSDDGLLLTWPILTRMKQIEGWLGEDEADLLIAATSRVLREMPPPHTIVEVGSYCGRSTVVFGSVVAALNSEAKVFAIDPHDGKVGALDQGIKHVPPTLEKFTRNIGDAGLTDVVEAIQQYSFDVEWESPISLLFIDGLHDYANVARDFFHFEPWVVEGGYIAFHDYADYYPGVKTFVNEILSSGKYRQVHCASSMMLVEKLMADGLQDDREAERQLTGQPNGFGMNAARRAAARRNGTPGGSLSSFQNLHQDETIIVCGCGASLNELARPERFITIGVNDVGRRFQPNYLVVVNPRNQFSGDRFSYVENSGSEYLFTQLHLGLARGNVIKFDLGAYGGTDFSNPNVLHHTQNSPYVALCLAVHMGARRIGLIGVDFTTHHFFAQTGTHSLASQVSTIDEQYQRLNQALRARGVEVFNLSRESRLTAFPKMSPEEFASLATGTAASCDESALSAPEMRRATAPVKGSDSLKIVSYATTPVAGVPAVLARCINGQTTHAARCVWAQSSYGNGVAFEGDVEWTNAPQQAEAELADADVVIVHNGKVDARHRSLLAGKAVLTMAHNYMWNVDEGFVRRGFPGVVVGQYQATLPEFKDWSVVPNPLPLWEEAFRPAEKGRDITICYTPSGKHESFPPDHRLYWHAKGYETTMRALERLASRFSLRLEVIRDSQVSHAESLAMKRRAHIVIDECVTGSYHRNSLEGLAAGCVVVNGVGLLPAVRQTFQLCAGAGANDPFVFARLEELESVLEGLVAQGAEALAAKGLDNRRWVKENWDFARQWERFWWPVVVYALDQAGRKPAALDARRSVARSALITSSTAKRKREPRRAEVEPRPAEVSQSNQGVSVIIPHGGEERLPHLAATLANLRRCDGANEVIVVEMGCAPVAADLARELADKYVFIQHAGVFERARALNTGLPYAGYDLLLWKDNDLLVPLDFINSAASELRAGNLDYLLPYTDIRYLSAPDSCEVMAGTKSPADCSPLKLLKSRTDVIGGTGLVRKAFVLEYGGLCEGFRGWGGEDNVWAYKSRLLGRAAATQLPDQHLFHLYHTHLGGYTGEDNRAKNPYYDENVALMYEMCAVKDRHEFIRRYPPPENFSCPWPKERRIVLVADDSTTGAERTAEQLAHALENLYGFKSKLLYAGCDDSRLKEQWREAQPDAIVLFGNGLAQRFLADDACAHLRAGVLVVQEACADLSSEQLRRLSLAAAVLSDGTAFQMLQQAGLRPWPCPTLFGANADTLNAALALAQPLSLILGREDRLSASERCAVAV